MPGVLVSQSCNNKVPQTVWLQTTEMYFCTFLKVTSAKSRRRQDAAPSQGPKEDSVPGLSLSSWWLPAILCSSPCRHITPVSAPGITRCSPVCHYTTLSLWIFASISLLLQGHESF